MSLNLNNNFIETFRQKYPEYFKVKSKLNIILTKLSEYLKEKQNYENIKQSSSLKQIKNLEVESITCNELKIFLVIFKFIERMNEIKNKYKV